MKAGECTGQTLRLGSLDACPDLSSPGCRPPSCDTCDAVAHKTTRWITTSTPRNFASSSSSSAWGASPPRSVSTTARSMCRFVVIGVDPAWHSRSRLRWPRRNSP
jgi:hypothetical protein